MNTKWEETFDEEFSLNKCGERWIDGTLLDSLNGLRQDIKAFIKDQITKAQQEIAEQILQDIPSYDTDCRCDDVCPEHWLLKSQLRKKYIKKDV